MPRPTPLPDALPEAFAYAHARQVGVSSRRLRGRDLEAPHRGARLRARDAADIDDTEPGAIDRLARRAVVRRIDAYETVRQPHAFYTGRTALGIYGLPFAYEGPPALSVAVYAPQRAPRMAGIIGMTASRKLTTVIEHAGYPVTSPASTWAMLATELTERELTILADAIVRIPRTTGGRPEPRRQLATLEQLRAAAMAPRRRGRAKLLGALARARVGSMSVLESDYRLAAEDAGLPEPELDVEIRDARGRLIGIGDLVHSDARVIVEVEGDHHRTSRAQWERDIEKHAAYVAAGWGVVRVTSRHIRGSQRAVELVAAALERAAGRT